MERKVGGETDRGGWTTFFSFHPTLLLPLFLLACLMILYLASHTSTLDEDHHYLAHPSSLFCLTSPNHGKVSVMRRGGEGGLGDGSTTG
jgi:hypothetical protein